MALSINENQYKAGTGSYLNVMTAQTAAISNQKVVVAVLGQRLTYSVQLIKAQGGGWDNNALPDEDAAAVDGSWTDMLPFPVQ